MSLRGLWLPNLHGPDDNTRCPPASRGESKHSTSAMPSDRRSCIWQTWECPVDLPVDGPLWGSLYVDFLPGASKRPFGAELENSKARFSLCGINPRHALKPRSSRRWVILLTHSLARAEQKPPSSSSESQNANLHKHQNPYLLSLTRIFSSAQSILLLYSILVWVYIHRIQIHSHGFHNPFKT